MDKNEMAKRIYKELSFAQTCKMFSTVIRNYLKPHHCMEDGMVYEDMLSAFFIAFYITISKILDTNQKLEPDNKSPLCNFLMLIDNTDFVEWGNEHKKEINIIRNNRNEYIAHASQRKKFLPVNIDALILEMKEICRRINPELNYEVKWKGEMFSDMIRYGAITWK